MEQLVGHIISVFMGFFAIMNPIANTPIFLSLTAEDPPAVKKQIARKSLLIAFGFVVAFSFLGRLIFSLFGITLPAFKIMGGVLVALIGYQMLHGEQSAVHRSLSDDPESDEEAALSVAVTPLAIPILSGPGTLATAMNFSATGHLLEALITIVTFAVLCLITYVFFIYGERVVRYLGRDGLSMVTRIMGFILAVIGVQMLLGGIAGAIAIYHK